MNFRLYLLLLCVCVACTPIESTLPPENDIELSTVKIVDTKQYIVRQKIALVNTGEDRPEKQNLWVALIQDFSPYQEVISSKISPKNYELSTDEYGNQYAEFDLSTHLPGSRINIQIEYKVSVNEISYDSSNCEGELIDAFTQSELHIESANRQIISLAEQLSKRKGTICEQVRAFYDYAGDELFYSFNQKPWGAQATFGRMGADCTEYASLVIALSRAKGIPARYYEGLLYLEDKKENIAQTEHAWLDVYFPGMGWVGMDPTLGRLPSNRDSYFAHYTPDHIIITTGRNPSTLRGASYWSHLYWPGDSTTIQVTDSEWTIELNEN